MTRSWIRSILAAVGVLSGMQVAQAEVPAIHFEPNVGQTDTQVRFLARGQQYGIYLTSTETVLALRTNASSAAAVLRLRLVGANRRAQIEGRDRRRGTSNYFVGNDPTKWHRGVPHYGTVLVQQIYPGIDLAYHGNPRQLEYDFLVAPGADPGRIRLAFDGITGRQLDREGSLVLVTKTGNVVQKPPFAYQDVAGVRKTIECRYELTGPKEARIVVGAYDRQHRLVIDPVLLYSTYLGGSAIDEPRAVAVDGSGAIHLTGYTGFPVDTPFPTTPGAFQTTYGGGNHDVFVSKLHPAGQGAPDLAYSTYLGGPSDDDGWGIAVDGFGAVYVVGETSSAGSGFPTTPGAFQTSSIDGRDAFVVKLDASGGLAYATYLGGGSIDTGREVAVDPSGTVHVGGFSASNAATGPFPTTAGAYQTNNAGSYDAFVVQLDPQGAGTSDLRYSTLFGGPATEVLRRIKLHGSTVYIAGYSSGSGALPTTPGAYQVSNAGSEDAFLAVLTPNGTGQADLIYATYLGGGGSDVCFGLAVDSWGVAYLGGRTGSRSPGPFPTTPGAYQTSMAGIEDAFVAKIHPVGGGSTDLVYSSYVGGISDDSALDLAIDDAGTVFLTGRAGPGYPTVAGAYQEANAGEYDAFMTRLNPAGGGAADLLYSTFFGGSDNDFAYAIAVGADGVANIAGSTFGVIPTTEGAFQTANAGSLDVFLARLVARPSIDLFLHGGGPVENPHPLFLDRSAPGGATPKNIDSGAVKFAGGNPWKSIGTWSGSPGVTTGTLVIGGLDTWLGLKKSDDEGARFDLRAELLKNGSLMDSGELHCIEGLAYDAGSATRVSLSFEPPVPTGFDGTADVLSLRLLTRIGTDGVGNLCGGPTSAVGLRVYFDALSRPAVLSVAQP